MLHRGLRFSLAAGTVLLVLALALYILLREYNAPESVEFGLLVSSRLRLPRSF